MQKVTKASQQTLKQAKETIKQLLASQNQQKALDAFVKDFRKKWKDKTNCRDGFVIQDCKNAPKPKTTATAPPGAVPQQPQNPTDQPQGQRRRRASRPRRARRRARSEPPTQP